MLKTNAFLLVIECNVLLYLFCWNSNLDSIAYGGVEKREIFIRIDLWKVWHHKVSKVQFSKCSAPFPSFTSCQAWFKCLFQADTCHLLVYVLVYTYFSSGATGSLKREMPLTFIFWPPLMLNPLGHMITESLVLYNLRFFKSVWPTMRSFCIPRIIPFLSSCLQTPAQMSRSYLTPQWRGIDSLPLVIRDGLCLGDRCVNCTIIELNGGGGMCFFHCKPAQDMTKRAFDSAEKWGPVATSNYWNFKVMSINQHWQNPNKSTLLPFSLLTQSSAPSLLLTINGLVIERRFFDVYWRM